jgi:hypothetical protein
LRSMSRPFAWTTHVEFKVTTHVRGKTDQILYPPTRVMLCDAINQGLYDPITELREQLGRGREKGH